MPNWKKVIVSGSSAHLNQITGSGGVKLADDAVLNIGDENDLQLYHDGSNSYIKDNGTGNLNYLGGTQTFQNAAGSKTMLVLNSANSVDLNYNNSTKLETTNTGVDVTGIIQASGNISGSSVSTGSFGRVNVAGTLDAGAVTDELAAIIVAQIDDDEIPIAKLAEDSVTYVAGTGLTGGGVAALGNSAAIHAVGGNGITANANDLEITPAQTTIESIYKEDLVIGEDAQTQIDFETANEIHFDVNNIELLNLTGAKISGSSVSTGSFGKVEATNLSGDGTGLTNVTDVNAVVFGIVFGG